MSSPAIPLRPPEHRRIDFALFADATPLPAAVAFVEHATREAATAAAPDDRLAYRTAGGV
jgi:hypothetical protein